MGWLDEPLCVSTEYEVGDANTDCTLSRFCNGSLWEEKHQLGFKIKDYIKLVWCWPTFQKYIKTCANEASCRKCTS